MEVLVIGGLGVGAYWLMKTPTVDHREGMGAHAEDTVESEGIMKPYGNLGDLNSQQSLAMQYDTANPKVDDMTQSSASFHAYMNTEQGQVEFQAFKAKHKDLAAHKATKEFERNWRHKHHDADEVNSRLKDLNKRALMNAAVQSTNAFDPDRMTTIRNRANSRPMIAAFMGDNTQIGGQSTWIDHSPYTVTNFESIEETPYASSRDGIHTDAEPLVDQTPVVSTMAPTRLLHHKGGAVRMNYKEMKTQSRKVRFDPLTESANERTDRKRAKRPEY
jgi:hypothetical protein